MSNIYGMRQGQSLGQGTFIFDRICSSRYDLDFWASKDNVLVGRYALIEYDKPIMVVESIEDIKYDSNKIYNIYKMKTSIVDEEEKKEIDFSNEENPEYIFVCTSAEDGKYNYYYALLPEIIISEESPITTQDSSTPLSFQPFNNNAMDPVSFNKMVDIAYANKSNIDDIKLEGSNFGWDSTAWLKIAEQNNNNSQIILKYLNVANLNVISPNIISGETFIPTFQDKTGTFSIPQIHIGDTAAEFIIDFPSPIDIKINMDADPTTSQEDYISSEIDDDLITKKFIFHLPTIGNAKAATTAALSAAATATAAADRANTAAAQVEGVNGLQHNAILDSIGTTGIKVFIGGTGTTEIEGEGDTSKILKIRADIDSNTLIDSDELNSIWKNILQEMINSTQSQEGGSGGGSLNPGQVDPIPSGGGDNPPPGTIDDPTPGQGGTT